MKHGFRIVVDRSISEADRAQIDEFIAGKIEHFTSPNSYKTGGWCSAAFYRRGIFGLSVEGTKVPRFTFRRLSKHRRIFGVVPVEKLERLDGKPLELNCCMCAHHRGGQRVRLKDGFNDQDFITVFETGDIKG